MADSNDLEEAKRLLLQGNSLGASNLLKKVLKKDKSNTEALHGLALSFFFDGNFQQAEKYLLKAINIEDCNPELYSSLGILYLNQSSWEKAAESFENAKHAYEQASLTDDPKYLNMLQKLANIYVSQQKYVQAKEILKRILKFDPDQPGALQLLAKVYVALLQHYNAIEMLEKLPLEKSVLEALKTEVFLLKEDYRNALKCASEAVKLDPNEPQYYSLLGECYIKTQELEKSIDTFKKGLDLKPNDPQMLSRLLALFVRLCDWNERKGVIENLRALAKGDPSGKYYEVMLPTIAILSGFGNDEIQKVVEARSNIIEKIAKPVKEGLRFVAKRPLKKKKIKIGYLSSDFHNHATAHLMLEVFALHDRKKFEIAAYSYGKKDNSFFRKKIKSDCDHFIDISKISDRESAVRIYEDEIDILVDLKGHITDHRLGIPALRPAPIQIHYLGYPGTIGAPFIDYLIADQYIIPKSERKFYTESIIYLPYTYQANTESAAILKKTLTKNEYQIPENAFVFCCFNQNDKLDTETVSAWMKILQGVPNSVLWLWRNYPETKEKLKSFGKEHNIDPKRFIISSSEPHAKHLARMQLGDLFLDTFYYNAHTSCSDAIRVGLPVLTCPGKTFASRVAASLLKNVKVNELIAKDVDDYIAKAVEFAVNPAKLKRVKEKINKNRDASHLYDSKLFTKHLDQAYQRAWEIYQSGKSPRDFKISAD